VGLGWWSVFIVERRWVNHQFGGSFDNFDELLAQMKWTTILKLQILIKYGLFCLTKHLV
jgi:hypothetical protein